MRLQQKVAPRPAMDGEDISTTHWEDARLWLGVYADLLRFKRRLLDRVKNELRDLNPVVQQAAADDLLIIENQMGSYQARLDLWYQRVWELRGFWLDPETRMARFEGRETHLTEREFDLLKFFVDRPDRFYTAQQITSLAWGDSALSPEEVRNYVMRVRKLVVQLEVPCVLVNRPGRGYSLVFRTED